MDRRLAAVLVADVAGYARLMEAYEFETHARLTAIRHDIIEPKIANQRGRIIKHTGDGFVAIFDSVHSAVQCAIIMQQTIRQKEATEAAERRITFRMGLNVGDVVIETQDVFGTGVIVAARLQDLAEPGGLMISAAVQTQVTTNLDLATVDLGHVALTNIEAPIHAFRVLISGDGSRPRSAQVRLHKHASIAVLPFRTLDANPAQTYFGDGIVEDIIGALAALEELLVISRNSTLCYRDVDVDVRRVARELGVRYVLSGSVRRSLHRIRISAELADAETGLVLWVQSFDFDSEDLFQVQDRITTAIVAVIAPRVQDAEVRRAFLKRPDSMDASDHILQALALLFRLTQDDFIRAGTLLRRAIALDDSYATSYALAAEWHGLRIGQGWSPSIDADGREAIRLADAALERDPINVRALALLGHYKSYLVGDYDSALALFQRAISASPNNAWAWGRSAATYCYIGNGHEAIGRAEEALRLSPQDPFKSYFHASLSFAHYTNGSYEQAVKWGQVAIQDNPRFTAAAWSTAAAFGALGRPEAARDAVAKVLAVDPTFRASRHAARYPYRDPDRRALLERHLTAAGLPP